jgi:hypothetical protein
MGGTHRALSYCAPAPISAHHRALLFTPYPPSFASDVMKADIAIITIREDDKGDSSQRSE